MSANFSNNKKQKFVTESKRPKAVLLLSSEEELSDKRSSNSIESSPRQIEESKSHRSARKASKKSWQETLALLDCQFSSSSTDEEWNNMIPNNTSDSDLDWSPMQKTQSRSSAPARLTNVGMKRAFAETAHSPAPVAEPNFKHSDSDYLSTPPKLMAIDSQPKKSSLKPHCPPVLKEKPISLSGIEEQCLIEEKTSPTIIEKEGSPKSSYPPTFKLGKNGEATQEVQKSLCSLRVPKVKMTRKKTTKGFCSYQQKNHCHSPKPTSLSSSEEISVSVASPGPPELIPIFDKSKRDSPVPPPLSFIEEADNLFPKVNEDETSDSSLTPPTLTFKSKNYDSQKSLELQALEETAHNTDVCEEDQAIASSPGPPKIMESVRQPKKRSHKSSPPPILNVKPPAVIHKEDQQISIPAAPELATNVNKSKVRSKKSIQPQKQSELISTGQSSKSPVVPLKPKSTTRTKVEKGSSKMTDLPSEDRVPILSEKEQFSKTPLSSPLKQMPIAKKKKSTPVCSPLPTAKTMPSLPTSEEVHPLETSEPSTDCSLSFAGIIPYKASLLEKGFDSGKFIMLKSDLKTQKSPSIWRIDGKNLLQKYESISHNNEIAYRNISTYSSWMASNKGLYVPIEVEFSVQSKSEIIVTFDRNKVMLPIEDGMMEALNEEANSMIDTFQIYLQTLMSQALDSNFVKEIVNEQDDYFLTSIAVVEDHWILPKRNTLKEIIKMKKHFQELVETHPGLELRCVTSGDKSCDSCNGRNPTRSVEFLPLSYSFDTLDIMEGTKPSNKTYRLCLSCTDRILLYHELFHMRYHLFTCCQKKVNQYDQRDGPAALTSSLADQAWKSLMHRRVLLVLAETQQVISRYSADACVV